MEPPEKVLSFLKDEADRSANWIGRYKVRGLKSQQGQPGVGGEGGVSVLAIRHAAILRQDDGEDGELDKIRWSVPSHLGVDKLEW